VDLKPTLTAAGYGSLTALTLTAMGRLPKVSFPESAHDGVKRSGNVRMIFLKV